MMKMDADIVVMTMPDLDNFHIKRSYIRQDIEYIYMGHGIGSVNLLGRKLALAHYDTIFCIGEYQVQELKEEERIYALPPKNLIQCGYGLLDHATALYKVMLKQERKKPQILIAPSWQIDNILEICIAPMLSSLLCGKYHVILRPHPEYCKRYPQKISILQAHYKNWIGSDFEIQTDFSSTETVFQSDIVITDWSSICYEFSFITKRPTLFINTPMKIMNPDYQRLGIVPLDIFIREKVGKSISVEKVSKVDEVVEELLMQSEYYKEKIEELVKKNIYNLGKSAEVGGQYIINSLLRIQSIKKKEKY